MERITLAEANARSFARCANCFDLIGARSTPPDLILMGVGGKGNAVHLFYPQPGETQAQLWNRVVRSASLMFIASDGRRPRVECLYADAEDPRVWHNSPLGAPLQ